MIPVIDLFAGPGGLGEGFSAFRDTGGKQVFKIVLSREKDPIAHETLKPRSFFRQFAPCDTPKEYYEHLRGELARDRLYAIFPKQSMNASEEATKVIRSFGVMFGDVLHETPVRLEVFPAFPDRWAVGLFPVWLETLGSCHFVLPLSNTEDSGKIRIVG